MTASFFAELARRAELLAANDDADATFEATLEATFEATADHVHRALTELHATRQALITGTQKAASLNQPHDWAPR